MSKLDRQSVSRQGGVPRCRADEILEIAPQANGTAFGGGVALISLCFCSFLDMFRSLKNSVLNNNNQITGRPTLYK